MISDPAPETTAASHTPSSQRAHIEDTAQSSSIPTRMAPSDREQLVEMGFDSEKVDIALKKTGGCETQLDKNCESSTNTFH